MRYTNFITITIKLKLNNMKDVQVLITPLEKDYYNLTINLQWVGKFERSELRHIIQEIDNKI